MKKFSKILTLLLSLVLIVTAFTVITLATDEATELSTPYVRAVTGSWESKLDGEYLGTGTRGMRRGYVYAEADVNGNMYEVYMPGVNKGSSSDVWYDTLGDYSAASGNTISREYTDAEGNTATKKITKYNLADYPYVVYDFDIMTPTGNFGAPTLASFSYRTYAYFYTAGGGFGYSATENAVNAMSDTGDSLLNISPSNVFDYLDDTPYNWQHVTLISKAFVGTNGPAFEVYVYVDGEQMNTEPFVYQNSKATFANYLLEDLGFAYIRHSSTYSGKEVVDLSGVNLADTTTWPDCDPSEWYEDKTALDNPEFTHFQADWTPEAIAARSWEKFESTVPESAPRASASLTKTDGSVVYFASAEEAIAAAAAGEKVTVLKDLEAPVVIDKAIIFDTAMNYVIDTDGSGSGKTTASYFLGEHYAPFYSTVGVAYEYADGVYTFTDTADTYTVNWDPDCEGECTCHEFVKHLFKGTTKVAVGNNPTPIKNVTFEPINGNVIALLGWKTSPEGETVQLSDVSAAAGETVTLYPVYNITQYDFEVINSFGESSFYFAKDFGTQMQAVAKAGGATLKLHNDVYTECAMITVTAKFTLDLNGHKLMRTFIYGDFYEVTKNAETGEYVVPETATGTVADSAHFFTVNADNAGAKVISTNPGGTICNSSMNAVVWTYEGEVVKRTSSSTNKNGILFYMPSSQSCNNFYLNLSDVNLYLGRLWYQNSASAGGTNGFTLTIDNCKIYKMSNDTSRFIEARSDKNYTIIATDTLFYAPASTSFIFFGTNGSETATAIASFTNCDFVKKDASYNYSIADTNHKYNYVTFDNCRLYDVSTTNGVATNGTLYRSSKDGDQGVSKPSIFADGYVAMEKTITYSYTVPAAFDWTVDTSSDINTIDFNVKTTTRKQTYEYVVTKEVDVNWIGGDGQIISTEKLYPGVSTLTPPTVDNLILEDDLYRNIAYQWADAKVNGNALTEVLGLDGNVVTVGDEYNFYAVTELNGVTNYVASLKELQLSLAYVGQFWTILYLPVVEGMDAPTVDNEAPAANTVLINRVPYYVYTTYNRTTSIFNDDEKKIEYTVDGVEYSKTITVSGLLYAELVLNNTSYTAEHASVANMVRYVLEAYELKATTDETVAANLATYSDRITALIGTKNADGSTAGGAYSLPAYATEYETVDSNISEYSEYIHSVSFALYGTSVRTIVTLTPKATEAGVAITKIYANGTSSGLNTGTTNVDDGTGTGATVATNCYYDNNQRVYNAVGKLRFTLSIPATDTEEAKTVSITYSLANYITAITEADKVNQTETDIDIAKALYAFGTSAKAYIDGLTDY